MVNSEAYFTFTVCPSKIIDLKPVKKEDPNKKPEVKLFDFQSNDLQESFTENKDSLPPLDSHKLQLNLVFHDAVLPPLR